MSRRRKRVPRGRRVGRVSYFQHHGSWYLYYRDGARPVRIRVGLSEADAARLAAERNAELARGHVTTLPTFEPVAVAELRQRFLDRHEHVLGSSLATVNRYRTATAYVETFTAAGGKSLLAHEVRPDAFLSWLGTLRIAPNGHAHSAQRPLRERGIQFILDTCRSLYQFAAKQRHLPPYASNPFSELASLKLHEDDAKPIFVFDQEIEPRFLDAADDWSFPIHFVLAKTGIGSGEVARTLVEEFDQDDGWLHVRGKPQLANFGDVFTIGFGQWQRDPTESVEGL
ncbi:MAG TPA: hypothetical protein VMR25_06935 [Planctomycetaceae bacterium]|jgi:integrase|nr:hypothetical protein [Planctomycetaceae bacterium]